MTDLKPPSSQNIILLTGATGYIGGRLLSQLEEHGYRIRCLARRPENLEARASDTIEIFEGDVLNKDSLHKAMEGVHTAYYLVHSMGSSGEFEMEERQGAKNFSEASDEAGIQRIIYLGGLGDANVALSKHLSSRHLVGDILRTSKTQVIEFRASIVIGSGSISFEIIRALVERLPIMITPRWVSTLAQPISIKDVLLYLRLTLEKDFENNHIIEIGGADVVSYGELMKEYAKQRKLKRFMIPIPVLSPRLSSLWLGLVTPVYARIGRKLIDSLRHPSVVTTPLSKDMFPITTSGINQALSEAILNEDREFAQTRWSDSISSTGRSRPWGGVRIGTRLFDTRTIVVTAHPAVAFSPIRHIGGASGWYFANFLWRLRGFLDLLSGGVGMRRGRKDSKNIAVGDIIDWWRVERYEPCRSLRLYAEMKLPGRAWLEFEIEPLGGDTLIRQTAEFDAVGLPGLAYWYILWPLHNFIFRGMIRNIGKKIYECESSR